MNFAKQILLMLAGSVVRQGAFAVWLRAVMGVRQGIILAAMIMFALQITALAFAGAVASAIWLWGGENKLVILFSASAIVALGAFALCLTLLSEKTWVKLAGGTRPAPRR